MIKNQDPQTTERLTRLTLYSLSTPQSTFPEELTQALNADADTIRHDLNWVSDFLARYGLVVDPSVDQCCLRAGKLPISGSFRPLKITFQTPSTGY